VAALPVVALGSALPGAAWAAEAQWEDTFNTRTESFTFAEMEFDPTGSGWAVGDYGWWPDGVFGPREGSAFAWRWDGSKWTGYGSGSFPDITKLTAVSAAVRNDVWTVGERWDRTAMTNVSVPLHWDGSTWTTRAQGWAGGEILGVSGSGTNVWAVGRRGTQPFGPSMRRWNGSAWTEVSMPAGVADKRSTLYAVEAAGPDDVWAVGDYLPVSGGSVKPLILHWDGSRVTSVPSPIGSANGYVTALHVRGAEVWVGGAQGGVGFAARFNGSSWSVTSPTTNPISSFALYGGELRAADHSGKVYRWNGSAWSAASAPRPATLGVARLATGPDGSLWYAGRGGVDEAHKYDEIFMARLRPGQ
jgi:hypothetical protein